MHSVTGGLPPSGYDLQRGKVLSPDMQSAKTGSKKGMRVSGQTELEEA